jgi:hypothetical protein
MEVYAMLFKGKKHRALRIILSAVCILILICVLLDCFFPSFHSEIHRGIDYYSDGAYEKLGHGFNRYGRIASKYLPSYDEVSKDAEYIDFAYVDANHYVIRNVAVCVGARYPEEIYTQKRDELLKQGVNIGSTAINGEVKGVIIDDTECRLLERHKRVNGEYMYYVTECSDKDHSIMYVVFFSSLEHNEDRTPFLMWYLMSEYSSMRETTFWIDLHPILYPELKNSNYISSYVWNLN